MAVDADDVTKEIKACSPRRAYQRVLGKSYGGSAGTRRTREVPQREGVNAMENCLWLAEKYTQMLQDNKPSSAAATLPCYYRDMLLWPSFLLGTHSISPCFELVLAASDRLGSRAGPILYRRMLNGEGYRTFENVRVAAARDRRVVEILRKPLQLIGG
ncbi:hypothetical protein B0H12DRAFT_1220037 [Mycena haematopus]|nr:hypothetical protein B0H12DRAFT_1220037 [Mycena haematopus]